MRLYVVERDDYDWDEYDSVMVKAKSAERAHEIAIDFYAYFGDKGVTVTEIHLDDFEEIVHTSFNAG